VQFVRAIQPSVEAMTVFQRTPAWVVPRHDHEVSERARRLLRAVPLRQRLARPRVYLQREWLVIAFRNPALMRFAERAARKHLEVQVKDPELRAKLLPDYRLGCKRILISNDYLPALDQPNVTLATDGVGEISIVDNAGVEHRADAIRPRDQLRDRQLRRTHQPADRLARRRVVIDSIGGQNLVDSIRVLVYRGTLVSVGVAARAGSAIEARSLWTRNNTLRGVYLGGAILPEYTRIHPMIGDMLERVASGELHVEIDRSFPLAQAAAAHAYIESRKAFGRVTLTT
jgi:hypothetical protein